MRMDADLAEPAPGRPRKIRAVPDKKRRAPGPEQPYPMTMNKPRILLPFAVAGLVLAAALATATLVNAAENPPPPAFCTVQSSAVDDLFAIAPLSDAGRAKLVLADATLQQADADALFAVAPLSEAGRARLVLTDASLQQAEADALFVIAPMSDAKRAEIFKAEDEAALQQAEVDAMFAVAPMAVRKQSEPAKDIRSERGREVYLGLCFACHLPDGKGVANVFPPLAGSDYLLADHDRAVQVVLKGLIGPVKVNGVTYNSAMPPLETTLAEEQVADVLTYVTGEWGNQGAPYNVDDVRRVKDKAR
jgi:mono/diheme cytochrome c family protein